MQLSAATKIRDIVLIPGPGLSATDLASRIKAHDPLSDPASIISKLKVPQQQLVFPYFAGQLGYSLPNKEDSAALGTGGSVALPSGEIGQRYVLDEIIVSRVFPEGQSVVVEAATSTGERLTTFTADFSALVHVQGDVANIPPAPLGFTAAQKEEYYKDQKAKQLAGWDETQTVGNSVQAQAKDISLTVGAIAGSRPESATGYFKVNLVDKNGSAVKCHVVTLRLDVGQLTVSLQSPPQVTQGSSTAAMVEIDSTFPRNLPVILSANNVPAAAATVEPLKTVSVPISISAGKFAATGPLTIDFTVLINELPGGEVLPGAESKTSVRKGSINHEPLQIDFDTGDLSIPVGTNDPTVPQAIIFPKPNSASALSVRVTNPSTETTLFFTSIVQGLPAGISLTGQGQGFRIPAAISDAEASSIEITVPIVVAPNASIGTFSLVVTPKVTDLLQNQPAVFVVKVTTLKTCKGWQLAPYDLNGSVHAEVANLVIFSDGTWRFLWRLFDDSTFTGDHFSFGWQFPSVQQASFLYPQGVPGDDQDATIGHQSNFIQLTVNSTPLPIIGDLWPQIFQSQPVLWGTATGKGSLLNPLHWPSWFAEAYKDVKNWVEQNKGAVQDLSKWTGVDDPTGLTNPALVNGA